MNKQQSESQVIFLTAHATSEAKKIPDSISLKRPILAKDIIKVVFEAFKEIIGK